jgi:hypothetical protein
VARNGIEKRGLHMKRFNSVQRKFYVTRVYNGRSETHVRRPVKRWEAETDHRAKYLK